jgi:nucleoid-associated protein EbfC
MNMQEAMKKVQSLPAKMAELQKKLEHVEVTGIAGGGMVKFTANCKGDPINIEIDSSLLNDGDKEMLCDLIVAAIKNAKMNGEKTSEEEMAKLTSDLGIPPAMLSKLGLK